ncbi:hypothetical protein ACFL08_02795 [Patescibacteria group bacterium]
MKKNKDKTKKERKKINFKDLLKSSGSALLRKTGLVFILFFIILSGAGVYVLYEKVYVSEWTDEQKIEYLKSMQVSAKLNEKKFEEVVSGIRIREEYSRMELGDIKNIFE